MQRTLRCLQGAQNERIGCFERIRLPVQFGTGLLGRERRMSSRMSISVRPHGVVIGASRVGATRRLWVDDARRADARRLRSAGANPPRLADAALVSLSLLVKLACIS